MLSKLTPLFLLFAVSMTATSALSATNAITKTATAKNITVMSDGSGMSASTNFSLTSPDFPSGTLPATKILTSLAYSIAAYPAALTDEVQLCYYRPYAASPSWCKDVTPGSTSTINDFKKFTFGNGANVRINHKTTGVAGSQLKPSRQESVTYTYSY